MRSKLGLNVIVYVYLAIIALGCSKSDVGDFDQVDFIDKFPIVENVDYESAKSVNITSDNITEFRVVDSLLVVSVSADRGFWHVYTLPNVDSVVHILDVGLGVGELPMSVPCLMASFNRDESGHLVASIPATTAGKVVVADLSILSDSISPIEFVDRSMMSMCLMDYQLNGETSLRFNIDPERASVTRTLSRGGEEVVNEAVAVLNAKSVSDLSLISRLMTYPAISPNGMMVAEIPGFDANINIWSTSGDGALSIIKRDINNTEEVIEDRIADNKPVYIGGFGYDDFFTVQKVNYSASGDAESISIEFISWDGKALGCVNVNSMIRRADIDMSTGDLYLLDATNDVIKKVNISAFLSKIKL